MKLDPLQRDVVMWSGIGVVVLGLGYIIIKWVIPAIANAAANSAASAAGSVASGAANTVGSALQGLSKNSLTQGATDFSGNAVDYSQAGAVFAPVAAAENNLSGGLLASSGESIGSGLFSLFGPKDTSPSVYYSVQFPDGSKHAIGDTSVDSTGNFSYGGVTYRLGDDGYGHKLATPLTTIYGSGAG
jgi:hypothetical protein